MPMHPGMHWAPNMQMGKHRLMSLETAKQGTMVDASYQVEFLSGGSSEGLVKALSRLDGIQHVQLQDSEFDDD